MFDRIVFLVDRAEPMITSLWIAPPTRSTGEKLSSIALKTLKKTPEEIRSSNMMMIMILSDHSYKTTTMLYMPKNTLQSDTSFRKIILEVLLQSLTKKVKSSSNMSMMLLVMQPLKTSGLISKLLSSFQKSEMIGSLLEESMIQ